MINYIVHKFLHGSGKTSVPFAVSSALVVASIGLASCAPVNATETPLPGGVITSAPVTEVVPATPPPSPFIELTPVQNQPTYTNIDVSIQADQQAIIDQGQGGYTYAYDAQTKTLTPPQDVSMDTGGRSEFVKTANTQRAEIQKRAGENVEYTSVHTNANETQDVATSFNLVGGKWSIFWPEAAIGNQTFRSSSPSDWHFDVEVTNAKSQVKYGQLPLPADMKPEDVTMTFVGDNQIVEGTDKNGTVWAVDWRRGEWVLMMDIPPSTLLDTSAFTNYLKAAYPDNTAAQNDAVLKGATESNSVMQQDANGLSYKVVKDANGIPLFVKYQSTDGAWGDWQQSLETQKTTIDAVTPFIRAQIQAGIQTSLIDVLKQGFTINEVVGVDGKTYEIAATQDGYPLMIKDVNTGVWDEETLGPIFKSLGIRLGAGLDGSEKNTYDRQNNLEKYEQIVHKNFDILWIGGSMQAQTIKKWGTGQGKYFVGLANEAGVQIYNHPGIYKYDEGYLEGMELTRENVLNAINKRAAQMFDSVKQCKIPPTINISNEPFMRILGGDNNRVAWKDSKVNKALGDTALIDIYVAFYNEAHKRDLEVGKDVFFTISEYGINTNNPKFRMAIQELQRLKQEAAKRLNIAPADVKFGLALEQRYDEENLLDNMPNDNMGRVKPPTKEQLIETTTELAQLADFVYFTEISDYPATSQERGDRYSMLLQVAGELQIAGLIFENPLRNEPTDKEKGTGMVTTGLFNPDFSHGAEYYELAAEALRLYIK